MFGLNFQTQPLWLNLLIFAAGAVVIWLAGSRVSEYADAISDKTGLGSAFVGLLLLSIATGMPELGTTVAAASAGNATLALTNIFGGIAMQTAVLVIADLAVAGVALTTIVPDPVLILEGVLLTGLLGLILVAMVTGGLLPSFWGIGLWTPLLLAAQILALFFSYRYQGRRAWVPDSDFQESLEQARSTTEDEDKGDDEAASKIKQKRQTYRQWTLLRLLLFFAAGSAVILVAGVMLAQAGDALATQTGLGQSFVGATLLATATSLPEVSTTITAVKLGNHTMAISNIFGSNANMVLQLFLADVFYWQGPILVAVDPSVMFSAAVGIVLTVVYLVGLLEREDKTILGVGIDSAIVTVFYLASLVILYLLRGA